jgi:hypothetical protein
MIRILDLTVPYVTAAIESTDPFADFATNGIDMCANPDPSIFFGMIRLTGAFCQRIG